MRRMGTVLGVVMATALLGEGAAVRTVRPAEPTPGPAVAEAFGRLPLSFEPVASDFVARGPGYGLRLQPTGALLELGTGDGPERRSVAMTFAGGRVGAEGFGHQPLPGRVNHLTGDDPAGWRTDIETYARAGYRDVYPGVDVVWYGRQGEVEYDLVVAPGADPGAIALDFDGADDVRLDSGADLLLTVGGATLVHRAPIAYQQRDDRRIPVAAAYAPRAAGGFGIDLGVYDPGLPLVIDPVLVYSTFLGGTGFEEAFDVEVDGSGSAYIVGRTEGFDFPTLNPFQSDRGGADVVVVKLNPAGTALVYSTYLGGNGFDHAYRLAVDGSGSAYVTGMTESTDFPTQSPFQAAHGGGGTDAFVTKLSPSGASLAYSTYLGGSASDGGVGIAVDGTGNAYVSGGTASPNFPTANALQAAHRGGGDAFVAKLHASGSALVYASYLGGSGSDGANGVDVDSAGHAVVAGNTASTDFPLLNAAQPAMKNVRDGFVARLNPAGTALIYSTYLGGTAELTQSYAEREALAAVASDAGGSAYVTGYTTAYDFPVVQALFPQSGSGYDAFITKLGPSGSFVYSTYLGSPGSESTGDIAVDSAGGAAIVGNTFGPVPFKNPIQPRRDGHDAFVTKINPAGTALEFSSHIGGDSEEIGHGIAIDGQGSIYAVGGTQRGGLAPDGYQFPTVNAVQPASAGSHDMIISKIAMTTPVPAVTGATWYSDGTRSRSGPAGSAVNVFATGAFDNVPYQLVLSTDDRCSQVLDFLNPTRRFAGSTGLIPSTRGTLPAGTAPGVYHLCFRADDGSTATAAATFTVQ